jgi:hypothetical protein
MSNGVVVIPSSLVTTHVQIFVIRASVGQPMDEPGIAVVDKDNGLVGGEERVKISIG